jgi:hypothetical protein
MPHRRRGARGVTRRSAFRSPRPPTPPPTPTPAGVVRAQRGRRAQWLHPVPPPPFASRRSMVAHAAFASSGVLCGISGRRGIVRRGVGSAQGSVHRKLQAHPPEEMPVIRNVLAPQSPMSYPQWCQHSEVARWAQRPIQAATSTHGAQPPARKPVGRRRRRMCGTPAAAAGGRPGVGARSTSPSSGSSTATTRSVGNRHSSAYPENTRL